MRWFALFSPEGADLGELMVGDDDKADLSFRWQLPAKPLDVNFGVF